MTRTLAVVTTEMALTGELTGLFTLEDSLLGGDDVLAGDFNGNAFDDLTGRDMVIGISRGAGPDLTTIEQGTSTTIVSDPDGDFNPENPTSPIADDLDVMRPIRHRATWNGPGGAGYYGGAEYGLATYGLDLASEGVGLSYGFVRDIEHDPDVNVRQSALNAVDFTEWLGDAGVKPVIASTGPISEGAAIGLVLDAAGLTDPTMRDLDDGGMLADFQADGSESGISLIGGIIVISLGLFFVKGSGVVRYISRENRFAPQSPVATLDGSMITGVRPRRSVDGVMNRITVTREGGSPQEAVDEASRRRYGYRDGSPITSPYFVSDAEALSLAQLKVTLYARGRAPLREVELINGDDVSIALQLSLEMGLRVAVQESMGGTDAVGEIVGIKHSFPGGAVHKTRFLVSSETAALTFFTLDDDTGASVLDGDAVLAY